MRFPSKALSFLVFACCILSSSLLTACGNESVKAQSFDSTNFRNISGIEANELIRNDNKIAIIDVRTAEEYSQTHIANATNIDFHSPIFAQTIATLPKDKTYLLYCRSGNRSGRALTVFKENGFEKVYNVSGGISAWASQGLPN